MSHLSDALDRMPQQMRDDPNAVALFEVLMVPFQQLEDAALAVLTQRSVDTAVGAQLDVIGRVVGQPRGDLDDATMRRYIRARILANRSRGIREDLIAVVLAVLVGLGARVQVVDEGTCEVVLRVDNIATTDANAAALLEFGQIAAAAGVRVIIETLPDTSDNSFTFDGPDGLGFVEAPVITLAGFSLPSGFDTVIGVRPEWLNANGDVAIPLTFQITFGVESFDDTAPALVFEAEAGTAIEDFENTIDSSQYLYIVSRSTVTGTNFTAGDVLGPSNFNGGNAGGVFARAED